MDKVDIILCGDYVVTLNDNMDVIKQGAVAIAGNKIVALGLEGEILSRYTAGKVIKGKDKAVLPGFINTHTHAAMVYFRGVADDLPLKKWIERHIWPLENALLSPDFVRNAIELACLEMIKAGVTTYNDMYFFCEEAASSTVKAGMRAVIGAGVLEFASVVAKDKEEYFTNALRLIDSFKGHELITPCIAPHAIYTCGRETLKRSKEIAEWHSIPIHIHLSETEWEVKEALSKFGMRPVHYLDSIGFLCDKVLAAHCVWLDESEIDLMTKRACSVSHCIESNMKLASGFAPVVKMLRRGLNVSVGTDGAASNNDLSVLSEIATMAKVHKAITLDPTAVDAKTALMMGTKYGARALGMGDVLGSLQVGKLADLITIDLKKPHLTPIYDIYSHIVYATMPSDVDTVIVNGKLLMESRQVLTLDEEGILQKAKGWTKKILDTKNSFN